MKINKLCVPICIMVIISVFFCSCGWEMVNIVPEDTGDDTDGESVTDAVKPDVPVFKTEYVTEYVGLYDYRDYYSMVKRELKSGQSAATLFTAEDKFDSICVYAARFADGKGKLRLSLYSWLGNYADTTACAAAAECEYEGFSNGAMLKLAFEDGAIRPGRYLFVVENIGEADTDGVGIYVSRAWNSTSLPTDFKASGIETFFDCTASGGNAQMAHITLADKQPVEYKQPNDSVIEDKDGIEKSKVILLGGQSNATGMAMESYLSDKITSEQFEKYKKGFDNVKIFYDNDSGGNSSGKFVNVALGQGAYKSCFGPEIGLAEYLSEKYPDQTFYIVKCANGGTSLETGWCTDTGGKKEGIYLTRFKNTVDKAISELEENGINPVIAGFIWMQGEADGMLLGQAMNYYRNEKLLAQHIRDYYKPYASVRGIAFIDGGINDCYMWDFYDIINSAKKIHCSESIMNTFIDTDGMNYDSEGADAAHFDSVDMIELGRLFGEAVCKYLK